ncbi:MAG: hypothetical protein WKF87_00435 [Chryseolinea sp.]
MKIATIILVVILTGCGGSLSDEQRKKLREGMEDQTIKMIPDAEIVTASLDEGRLIFAALEKVGFDSVKCDSIANQSAVRLRWVKAGSPGAMEVEAQLIQAYVTGAETGSTQDNIQKLRNSPQSEQYDTLLYSRPVLTPLPDGAVNVQGVWNIYMAKKDIVKGYKEN